MKPRTFVVLFLAALLAVPARATTLRVMKQGLGVATVTSTVGGISCPATCVVSTFTGTETVELNVSTTTGFVGWSGDCTGVARTDPCRLTMNTDHAVHA